MPGLGHFLLGKDQYPLLLTWLCEVYEAFTLSISSVLITKGKGGILLSHPHFMDEKTEVPFTD